MPRSWLPVLLLLTACRTADSGIQPELSSNPATRSEPTPPAIDAPLGPAEPAARSGVLVELFTSEGCSSCPPADRLLARLAGIVDESGEAIIPISFHVDYWNDIGWRDPFSSDLASERQRWYAITLGSSRLYTPQMIVAGAHAFVGSNSGELARTLELETAMQGKRDEPKLQLKLAQGEARGPGRNVALEIEGLTPELGLVLALVQDETTSQVTRGENAGSTLHHRNVVREFSWRAQPTALNRWRFALPADGKGASFSVVALLQNRRDGHVVQAALWPLSS